MLNNELISVIVAIYNGEKFLDECLSSLVNQDYAALEIILVNDGSTDESKQICEKFVKKDSRFKYLEQQNSGVSVARNNALKTATGEYIAIIDQDDYLPSTYFSYLLNLLKMTDADVSTTNKITKFVDNIPAKNLSLTKYKVVNGQTAAEEMLLYNLDIAPWNKIIKKSIICDNSISFVKDFFCGEGFAFSVECFQNSKRVAIGNEGIYFYRIGNADSGTSFFSPKKLQSSLSAQEYMSSVIFDKSKHMKRVLRYSRWHTCCDFLKILYACSSQKRYHDEWRFLLKEVRKNAFSAFGLKIKATEKIKALLYWVSPSITSSFFAKKSNKITHNKFQNNNAK